MLLALSALHQANKCHRDVKPDNVLVTMIDPDPNLGPRIKICDFGFSTDVEESSTMQKTLGTRLLMAPEMIDSM